VAKNETEAVTEDYRLRIPSTASSSDGHQWEGEPERESGEVSLVAEAKSLTKDLHLARKQWLYWIDFLFFVGVGWAAFGATLLLAVALPWKIALGVVSALALYRSVIFIHELAHIKPDDFVAFRIVWNLACGIPLLVPSFLYTRVHSDHHKRKVYGTEADGEYVSFVAKRRRSIVSYFLLFPVLPALLLGRFVVLTPLAYLHSGIRRLVWERASSLTIDMSYRRPPPIERDGRFWRLQEFGALVFGLTIIALMAAGTLSWSVLGLWYLISAGVLVLNSLRTLAAHCYRNPGDRIMSLTQQYLDSVDVPGNAVLTPLWAPVGLRYHATHHLLPGLPYHALGEAHRRLSAELSNPSLYHQATRRNLLHALRGLWHESSVAVPAHDLGGGSL
jgi:fatty acid desaturase